MSISFFFKFCKLKVLQKLSSFFLVLALINFSNYKLAIFLIFKIFSSSNEKGNFKLFSVNVFTLFRIRYKNAEFQTFSMWRNTLWRKILLFQDINNCLNEQNSKSV